MMGHLMVSQRAIEMEMRKARLMEHLIVSKMARRKERWREYSTVEKRAIEMDIMKAWLMVS